jgi:GTP-binding protein EngB required for normal cell division
MENIKTPRKNSERKLSKMKAPLFKIITIGDSDVGKSTLINTFIVKIISLYHRIMDQQMILSKNLLA